MDNVSVIILAAGEGSRLKQNIPKPWVDVLGKPSLCWIWSTLDKLSIKDVITVIHPDHQDFYNKHALNYQGKWVHQSARTGTATAAALGILEAKNEKVVVLYGDVPCLPDNLIAKACERPMALAGASFEHMTGYGMIVTDGIFAKEICENLAHKGLANVGVFSMQKTWALDNLKKIQPNGEKKEHWLTDLVALAYKQNCPFEILLAEPAWMCAGINTIENWLDLEANLNRYIGMRLLSQGVYIQDATSIRFSADMQVGYGVRIGQGSVFYGNIVLEDAVVIEPYCVITNSIIGKNTHVKSHSVIEDSKLSNNNVIGPFAHIIKTNCADDVEIGNYVEVKRCDLGSKNKVKHLSYLGDVNSDIGVNIGAGVVVCNYDGQNKWSTSLGKGVFIGSNVTLIAPLAIANYAVIGAASVITRDIPEAMLAVSRAEIKITKHKLCDKLQLRWANL